MTVKQLLHILERLSLGSGYVYGGNRWHFDTRSSPSEVTLRGNRGEAIAHIDRAQIDAVVEEVGREGNSPAR